MTPTTDPRAVANVPDSDVALRRARAKLLYEGASKALIANPLIVLGITIVMWGSVSMTAVLAAIVLQVAALGLRTAAVWQWRRKAPTDQADVDAALLRYRVTAGIHGAVWAITAVLYFPPDELHLQFFLLMILSSLVAGALASLGADFASYVSYQMPISLTVVGLLFVGGERIHLLTAALVAIFSGFVVHGAWQFAHNTARTLAQRLQLAQRKEVLSRYEFIVNSVPDAMSVISRDLRYEAVSDRWCEVMGHARDQVVGHRVGDIWGEAIFRQHILPELNVCFEQGRVHTTQDMVIFHGAGPRECSISYYPYFGGGTAVTHAVVVTRDVSELESARRATEQARLAAETASRAKSEFMASMSHELRTPLNAILGYAQLFVSEPNLDVQSRELAGEILTAGEHLLALVNDVIDLARIESGRLELSLETVLLQNVIDASIALVAPTAAQRQVKVISNYSGGDTAPTSTGPNGAVVANVSVRSDLCIHADFVRTRQVLINLLSNAIKYNRMGGHVELKVSHANAMVRIEVADNGPGIAPGKQQRLFTPFDRLGAESGKVEGTGIGLVISKRIIESMGGTIDFASIEGQGSQFWIELPEAANPNIPAYVEASVAARSAPGESPMATSRPVVLYVEDNPMNLKLMQHIFAKRKDFELQSAATAEIGLELVRSARPALILMDINLPGMSGYDALELLKANPDTKDIPVVALTANAMKGDAERGRRAGFDDYLTKPVDIDALLRVLEALPRQNPARKTPK